MLGIPHGSRTTMTKGIKQWLADRPAVLRLAVYLARVLLHGLVLMLVDLGLLDGRVGELVARALSGS